MRLGQAKHDADGEARQEALPRYQPGIKMDVVQMRLKCLVSKYLPMSILCTKQQSDVGEVQSSRSCHCHYQYPWRMTVWQVSVGSPRSTSVGRARELHSSLFVHGFLVHRRTMQGPIAAPSKTPLSNYVLSRFPGTHKTISLPTRPREVAEGEFQVWRG